MRIWFKLVSNARILASETVENFDEDTRTHKIFASLDEACYRLNLARPIWLDLNIREFQKFSKTRFKQDNFIEEIEFDYMEMQILDED